MNLGYFALQYVPQQILDFLSSTQSHFVKGWEREDPSPPPFYGPPCSSLIQRTSIKCRLTKWNMHFFLTKAVCRKQGFNSRTTKLLKAVLIREDYVWYRRRLCWMWPQPNLHLGKFNSDKVKAFQVLLKVQERIQTWCFLHIQWQSLH